MSKQQVLVEKTATFETEGRLLQELGERLVSSADVALVELIKNSYDADAAACWITRDDDSISVRDDGHGITEDEFLRKWMRIATGDKQRERLSRRYRRVMTGAKGIGRFAVRFLGKKLQLDSVAEDRERGIRTRLIAAFNWQEIDRATDLRLAKIPYRVIEATPDTPLGTTLVISSLRDENKIDFGKTLRNQVLGIVSPIGGLDRGRFSRRSESAKDPGFALNLPDQEEQQKDVNLAEDVLRRSYARVVIDLTDSKLTYVITHKDGRQLLKRSFKYPSHISRGVHADIRYFPRRAGMFQGIPIGGWDAWGWVRNNCGVSVIDHGFRVRPYGYEDDDWLYLQTDAAHNRRDWRSSIMAEHYTIPPYVESGSKEKANPVLYLPNFHQLVGAVFVESNQPDSNDRPTDLIPAINREGYLDNEGYRELVDIVRTGMELLAFVDHAENRRLEEEEAKKAASELRSDLRSAIQYIQKLPSLKEEDKRRITIEYTSLSKGLDKVEDYYRDASERMQTMALLGVIAGFMTHEAKALLSDMDKIVKHLNTIARSDAYVQKALPDITRTLDEFRGQVDYSSLFVGSLQDKNTKPRPVPVRGQLELVVERFAQFAKDRKIKADIDARPELEGPAVPVAVYSGIVLNLYTNALKAVVGGVLEQSERRIVLKAWNEPGCHILEVADNGVGIPPNLQKRIWDPLFTTTSGGSGNPLGSGMGLGLSLVKDIVTHFKGRVGLVAPPPGFNTCFKVELPNK